MQDSSAHYSSIKTENDITADPLNASNAGPLYAQWQGGAVQQTTPATNTSLSTNREYLYTGSNGYSTPINGVYYGNRSHSPVHESSTNTTTSSNANVSGYPFAVNGTASALVSAAPSPNHFVNASISRPPSVVHSPAHAQQSNSAIPTPQESFASRGRSTSYSGPYFPRPPTLDFSTFSPTAFSPQSQQQPHTGSMNYSIPYNHQSQTTVTGVDNSDLNKSSSLSSGATGYYNTDLGPSSLEQATTPAADHYSYGFGTTSTTLTPVPASTQEVTPTMLTSTTLPPPNSVQSLPPPIAPLSSSIATGGTPTIPRSMSMGSIPGSTSSPYASSSFNIPYGHNRALGFPLSFTSTSRTVSSGTMTPETAISRSHAAMMAASTINGRNRLMAPSLTIPASGQYLTDNEYMLASAGVSPITNAPPGAPYNTPTTMGSNTNGSVVSSLAHIRGTGSGPGTASNGGSLPLTPITSTESGEMFDYHALLAANLSGMSGIGSAHSTQVDGGMGEESTDGPHHHWGDAYATSGAMADGDDSRMAFIGSNGAHSLHHGAGTGTPRSSSPHRTMSSMLGGPSSPMGGVTRTEKKRRSTTMGPSAVAAAAGGAPRSRSGTLASGGPVVSPGVGLGGLGPLTTITGGMGASTPSMTSPASMAVSPVQLEAHSHSNTAMGHHSLSLGHAHGHNSTPYPALNLSIGMPDLSRSTTGVPSPLSSMMTSSTVLAPNGAVLSGNGQGPSNSPLAMKELSPTMKPLIAEYLLRYLNYLCMNPNAKDRMGHQIHQMYTARRIQRYEQLYGWRPLKFRIEAFVNGFVDLLTARGMSQDVTMKIPHYLNNSKLFSRFNESGNRMKSQGQTIWRVRARCKADIPGIDAPVVAAVGTAPNQTQSSVNGQPGLPTSTHSPRSPRHEDSKGLMMCPDPLLWEFLPYERCIVGQPPLAIVGTAWQWNMKVHDHWTPRKKINWSIVASNVNGLPTMNGSPVDPNSPTTSAGSPASADSSLPKWLSLQGSKLKGTPTHPGVYPITIEATFQEDNDPEPVVVRGSFTINVSKAIGGWKNKVPVSQDGIMDSPEDAMDDGLDGDEDSLGHGPSMGGLGGGIGGGAPGSMHNSGLPFMLNQHPDGLYYGATTMNPRMPIMQPQYSNTNGGFPFSYVH